MLKKTVISTVLAIMISTIITFAGDNIEKEFTFPKDDIDALEISFNLGAGEFNIRTKDMEDIATTRVNYNKTGKTGYLDFGSDSRKQFDIDTEDNRWDIVLSKRYISEIVMDIGACQADFDLGGFPLEYFDLDVGATAGTLIFSEVNPVRAEEMQIDAGAASFEIRKLGNANFKRFSFDGGVGKFVLDFSGEYQTKSKAKISIGLGEAIIHIPSNLPVRIKTDDSFLSNVDFENANKEFLEDDYYETDDFRSATSRLDLDISVSLGQIEIIFED